MRVYRCYTEKRPGFDTAAKALCARLIAEEGIRGLSDVRILHRYDVQGIDESVYASACSGVFSEPACDVIYHEEFELPSGARYLCVEALPGQFDMRADSCEQCIALLAGGARPKVRYATLYLFLGNVPKSEMEKLKRSLINPIESREAALDHYKTLQEQHNDPPDVPVLTGFIAPNYNLSSCLTQYSLAMDLDDLKCLRDYFAEEGRDPTLTELLMLDTYWSDHCRHTTFLTQLTDVEIEDPKVKSAYALYQSAREEVYPQGAGRPETLMDIATIGAKVLKRRGFAQDIDESEEINACSIRVDADIDGKKQPWLLMFKNETHNHPTEIEPFGGAATCLGGAIRDPLSGRAFAYQSMRVSGAADPRAPIEETLPGKLPQRVICRKAAAGFSSYGNQIGLATGMVKELYHKNYVAKRLEAGAVMAAAPQSHVVRKRPEPGDVVLLLGGRTGRDGCGGATGSSKSHGLHSITESSSEVQKGNAPEERKIQRLFRNPSASRLIKRCNDFGAGGVSVAVGELADGLLIDLDKVPKKYDGLNGTELAISESQERMAVVLDPKDKAQFMALAEDENLECTEIAQVTKEARLKMSWRGKVICDVSRAFLNSNGAKKSVRVAVPKMPEHKAALPSAKDIKERVLSTLSSLNVCIPKGLLTCFDGSVGAGSVLMPLGGKNQLSPPQVMAAKLPAEKGECKTASLMSYGFDPDFMADDCFKGAYASVLSSVAKLVAAGGDPTRVYLSLQEFFEKPKGEPARFGKPFAALLGALKAQLELKAPAIGGKDSMSGTFLDIDVPPTLISFAVSHMEAQNVVSPEFKGINHPVYLFIPEEGDALSMFKKLHPLFAEGRILSAWALDIGGAVEGLAKMAVGNDIGFSVDPGIDLALLFQKHYGALICEMPEGCSFGLPIGTTCKEKALNLGVSIPLSDIKHALLSPLEEIYPSYVSSEGQGVSPIFSSERARAYSGPACAKPLAIIPTFPGTNCEYDTLRAVERAGGEGEIVLVRNLNADLLRQSIRELSEKIKRAQMLIIPGGFSGGDEPEGSGKLIQAFFRAPSLSDSIMELLSQNDGLILGICNGFQALVKLGLLPFGEICALDESCPTVTFNHIGRHQSVYANTRISSLKSPWFLKCNEGDVYNIAFSHGEGRFMADDKTLSRLIANGQVATQYCDETGAPSMESDVNLNGSVMAIEGITSLDGRILGKMGHMERAGKNIALNIPGRKFMPVFEGGVSYFK